RRIQLDARPPLHHAGLHRHLSVRRPGHLPARSRTQPDRPRVDDRRTSRLPALAQTKEHGMKALLLLLVAVPAFAQQRKDPRVEKIVERIDAARMQSTVARLVSFGTRLTI